MYKYLILGAGPAGLSIANKLKDLGEDNFCVLEAEETAGGLCRSVIVDEAPFDIGGGHFLDVKDTEVNEFLFRFMPLEEWNKFERNSKIAFKGNFINSPFEANIWQMELPDQVKYLKSIAIAGCNLGKSRPDRFIDWIYWKLGDKIADEYMLPYNRKMFADELNELGTYWMEKLPNVSFEETLLSCLSHKAYGTQPGHALFYYPKKYGYGELWLRMANEISAHIVYRAKITSLDFSTGTVKTSVGDKFQGKKIINTIPWKEFEELIGIPAKLKLSIDGLKHTSVETRYFKNKLDTDAHWIYYPDAELAYHRILVRHNFCFSGKGYWTETRKERIHMAPAIEKGQFRYVNKYAYPLNTLNKPQIMERLLGWCEQNNVIGLGRWGEHQHFNSDVTVSRAIRLAERLI